MPPVYGREGLGLAVIAEVKRGEGPYPKAGNGPIRVGTVYAGAVLLRDAVGVGVNIDHLSLRFQHPVFPKLECVAGLRRHRPSLRVVVDSRQLASLHSVVEPAILEPSVHVGT
ncbi:hypothetical protein D3C87_1638540 [compost metagenome]